MDAANKIYIIAREMLKDRNCPPHFRNMFRDIMSHSMNVDKEFMELEVEIKALKVMWEKVNAIKNEIVLDPEQAFGG